MTDTARDELRARAVNLHRAGESVRSIAAALDIGRTAASTLVREIEATHEALPIIDTRRAAADALADALAEAQAAAAALDRLATQAAAAGDTRTALAIERERRLQRADRIRIATALAAAPDRRHAIEATTIDQ